MSLNQSWGIQTNIFETNIINLAVVIGVVIFFVGDAVKSLLAKREESILVNLQQAQQRANEMEQNYSNAQIKFQKASDEVIEISRQTEESIKKQEKQYKIQISRDLQRLEEFQKSTIYYQQQKVEKQILQRIIDFALEKVNKKFEKKLTQNVQKSINFFSIEKLNCL
uniref:ATP synthase subunit b, chloroplastic n=1 Tax=Tydemania expeditionis TaxID=325645 RepID=A0A0D6E1M7_TYDEX|nr:CF0 ATP synthase subunit I [Tydemania expeditionis]CEO91136.1 CF0 ATP synthase subunit I [Tydemania expeditionis]